MKYTQLPPALSEPWNFPDWDMTSEGPDTPPWMYRGFWYHDLSQEGTLLVVKWNYDCDGGIGGHIYRCRDLLHVEEVFNQQKELFEYHGGDGLNVICGETHLTFWPKSLGIKLPMELRRKLWRE